MANIPISSFTAAANATGIGMSGFSLTGANAQSMLDLAGTWNTSGTPTGLKLNVTDTASNAASLLMDLQVGGVSQFKVLKSASGYSVSEHQGAAVLRTLITPRAYISGDSSGIAGRMVVGSVGGFGFSSASAPTPSDTIDLTLFRDAANTLAQRNGVNAQTFRVYQSFTDASNYERGFVRWSTNELQMGTENAGTGVARDLRLVPAMNNNGNVAGQRLQLGGATFYEQFGYLTMASTGNGLSILQNISVGGNIEQSAGKFIQIGEGTAPAAPAVNTVRIYAQDNGAGKTQLMARFATGAAQQIAIEP